MSKASAFLGAFFYFLGALVYKLLTLPLLIIGVFAVAIGVQKPRLAVSIAKEPNGTNRAILRLPEWASWFDNAYDGLLGDSRKWWANNCNSEVFWGFYKFNPPLRATDKLAMWWWAGVRNPLNNLGRNILGIQANTLSLVALFGDPTTRDRVGCRSCYLAVYRAPSGMYHFVFEGCYDKGKGKGYYAQLGYKVRPNSTLDPRDPRSMKSLTFEINLSKRL